MTIDTAALVRREVHYCVSSLVWTLAQHWGALDLSRDPSGLTEMIEQAGELAMPIDDYEEAAHEAGWRFNADTGNFYQPAGPVAKGYDDIEPGDWRELCDREDIEPYQREVFEHWIVSDWLADKLEAKGEKVDRDFAGLTVWARTTTGQGIASDSVIEAIVEEINRG